MSKLPWALETLLQINPLKHCIGHTLKFHIDNCHTQKRVTECKRLCLIKTLLQQHSLSFKAVMFQCPGLSEPRYPHRAPRGVWELKTFETRQQT